jgi:hypothetical protein
MGLTDYSLTSVLPLPQHRSLPGHPFSLRIYGRPSHKQPRRPPYARCNARKVLRNKPLNQRGQNLGLVVVHHMPGFVNAGDFHVGYALDALVVLV